MEKSYNIHALLSLIFGIVGFFVLGIVFGPLAIWQSNEFTRDFAADNTERGKDMALAGKVLGWIVTGICGLAIVCVILIYMFALAFA